MGRKDTSDILLHIPIFLWTNQYAINAIYPHMHYNEQSQIHDKNIESAADLNLNIHKNIENAADLNLNIGNSNNDIFITSSVLWSINEIISDVQSVIEKEVQDALLYTLRRKTK